MPIYEYECGACGHVLDALQKISDKPLVKCPECSRRKLKRLVSAPRFRLKGEGWYETDFKKDNKRNLADSGEEKPAAKKDDGKPAAGSGSAEAGTKAKSAKTEPAPKPKTGSKSGDGPAP